MTPDPQAEIRRRAQDLGVALPPVARHPKRWWKPFHLPGGPSLTLPSGRTKTLLALLADMGPLFALSVTLQLLSSGSSSLIPWALGQTIDTAIAQGLSAAFAVTVLVFIAMVALVAFSDGFGEVIDNQVWMRSEFQTRRSVIARLIDRPRAMKRGATSGDVLTAAMDDAEYIGSFFETLSNATGAIFAIILVAYLMLSVSIPLGLTVLIGMPVALGLIALIAKPLEQRQGVVRETQGQLTTIATDAVQGLRILRGVGGERAYADAFATQSEVVRKASIRAAGALAALESASAGAPMLLIAIVVAQGAFLAYHGVITSGQLVAFFGYTFYLRLSLWKATRLVENLTRARVGAGRINELNTITPLVTGGGDDAPTDWTNVELSLTPINGGEADSRGSRLHLRPGRITGLVAPSPQIGAAIARGFARVQDPNHLWVNGQNAANYPVTALRSAIVLSEATPQIFAGTLREELQAYAATIRPALDLADVIYAHAIQTETQLPVVIGQYHDDEVDGWLMTAIGWAHAQDVVESLAGGLDGLLDEKGRNLSGGQRQRLALARAYATRAPVLILVEPTSALDAHTESLIGQSLQDARGGQTTLVTTHSPLLLAHCDEVVCVDGFGQELARGPFADLHNEQPLKQMINRAEEG